MGRKKENPVYSYFVIDSEQGFGRCLIEGCSNNVKSPICGNLEKHLKRHHPRQYDDLMKQKEVLASFVENRYGRGEGDPIVPEFLSASFRPSSTASPYMRMSSTSMGSPHDGFKMESVFSPVKMEDEHFYMSDNSVTIIDSSKTHTRKIVNENTSERVGACPEDSENTPNSSTALSVVPRPSGLLDGPTTESFHGSTSSSSSVHHYHVPETPESTISSSPVDNDYETDKAFCAYILKELKNVRNPNKKRMLKIKIVSEILNEQH